LSALHGHDDGYIYCISFADELKPTPVHLSQCGHYTTLDQLVCWSCARISAVDAELIRIARATELVADIEYLREMGVRFD